MAKVFCCCYAALLVLCSHAQSIYSFRFITADAKPANALLVLQPNGTAVVRYKLSNGIAEQRLQEAMPSLPDSTGKIGVELEATTNSLIRGTGTLTAFDIRLASNNNEWSPVSFKLKNESNRSEIPLDSVRFLTADQLTRNFVLQYYLPTEPFYTQLFNSNTKALTPLEKNTRFHLLIVANTNDSTVGTAAVKDMKTVEDFFSDMTEVMGIKPMNSIKIYGNNFSRSNVLDAIKKLAPAPNDIVVFYYTGHGFRTATKATPYPMYDLRSKPRQDYLKESLSTDAVAQLIKAKNHRMTMVLSDCCNWNPDMPLPYVPADPQTRSTNIPWDIEKCKALFLHPAKTNIIAVAADKNQLAVSNEVHGSFFFKYFRESMITVVNKTYRSFNTFMDWNYIAESTKSQTMRKSKRTYCSKPYIPTNICNQTPRFLIQ